MPAEMSFYIADGRLQIVADVDLDGLERLIAAIPALQTAMAAAAPPETATVAELEKERTK
jgi:hypothetical protein